MKALLVAAGVLIDSEEKVLVALRPAHTDLGGLWEFPGGKVEPGESIEAALARELYEEIGIYSISAQPFLCLEYVYSDRKVSLHVFNVNGFEGSPFGKEGQALRWVTLEELEQLDFPAANHQIISALKKQRQR